LNPIVVVSRLNLCECPATIYYLNNCHYGEQYTSNIRDYSNGINTFEKPTYPRPLVIGNYANHAFIIEYNVFEICPKYTKKHKLYDITQKASHPSPYVVKTLLKDISRSYDDSGTDRDTATDKQRRALLILSADSVPGKAKTTGRDQYRP
jgi:hypothetical protein